MRAFLGRLAENWQLKLLAFALAVLLWVVVSAEQVTTNWIPVPLEVRVTDSGYEVLESTAPDEVEVRFTGPGRELWDLVVRRPPLILSIDQVASTDQVFPLAPNMVQVPSQLAVTAQDVRPSRIRLRFRHLDTRELPVRVRVGTGLSTGLTLVDSLHVDPRTIEVSGPADNIGGLEYLSTVPIDLSPVDSVFSRTVPLENPGIAGLRLSADDVTISGRVEPIDERVIANVPVSIGSGVRVTPAAVRVRVRGARSVVNALRSADLHVVVAIDSVPDEIPDDGLSVPLRVDDIRPGLSASAVPEHVTLSAAPPPPETSTPAAAEPTGAPAPGVADTASAPGTTPDTAPPDTTAADTTAADTSAADTTAGGMAPGGTAGP